MAEDPSWNEVAPALLRGEGLRPYREGEIANLFDWAENPAGGSLHKMPYRGQFIVDVVEIEANAVHQPSKPGDEIVVVLSGVLELTDDDGNATRRYIAGEMVLIPAGWAGLYRVVPEGGVFRELAIVPFDYFDSSIVRLQTGAVPRRLGSAAGTGATVLHRGRYTVETERFADATTRRYDAGADEIIIVRAGRMTLSSGTETVDFAPGAVLVLPQGAIGTMTAAAGCEALTVRWVT